MNQHDRAKELATAHWEGYVKPLLEMHGADTVSVEIVGFHYKSAAVHFYLHAIEDERNGLFRPRIGEPLAPAEVEAICAEVAEIDFRLPEITLPGTADECRAKWEEEKAEYATAGGFDAAVEAWDVLQSSATWRDRECPGDGWRDAHSAMNTAMALIKLHTPDTAMKAKGACLAKNAARGYYSGFVNAAILAGTWRPE